MLGFLADQLLWWWRYINWPVPAILWKSDGMLWKVNKAFRSEILHATLQTSTPPWNTWSSLALHSIGSPLASHTSGTGPINVSEVIVVAFDSRYGKTKEFKVHPVPLMNGWVSFFYEHHDTQSLGHHFLNNYPVPYVILGQKGHLLVHNIAFERWLGYPPKTWTRLKFWSLLVDASEDLETLQRRPCGFRDASGHIKRAYFFGLTHLPQHCIGFFLVPSNLPLNRLTPETLFLEMLPMAALLLDDKGHIVASNQIFESIGRSHCPTSILSQHIHPRELTAFRSFLRHAGRSKQVLEGFVMHWTDGASHSVSARPLASRAGLNKPMLLLFHKPSSFSPLEVQTVEAQKLQALGQLASGIVHDFNNLLTGILGFCDLLLQRHKPPDPSTSDIQQIHDNANRAANLARQLLLFVRQMPAEPKPLSIPHCLDGLVKLLRRLLGARIVVNIVYETQEETMVYGDVSKIEQIFINLAINARDAMPEGGQLTFHNTKIMVHSGISLQQGFLKPGLYTLISVSDTGCGIAQENFSHIFAPFFTTKEAGHGTGLGLATVHQIIKEMGGAIDIKSTLGKGTTFMIYLPVHQDSLEKFPQEESHEPKEKKSTQEKEGLLFAQEEPLQENTEAITPGPSASAEVQMLPLTVLLAEDEAPIRQFVTRALESQGYIVYSMETGQEALEWLEDNPLPDLLITDVALPGVDGPSLVNIACKRNPAIPCIFVSGYTESTIKTQLHDDVKATFFLPKPFRINELLKLVEDVIAKTKLCS